MPEVSDVTVEGFSDAPCEYKVMSIAIRLHGGHDRVVYLAGPSADLNSFDLARIGQFELWCAPESGLWFGHPECGTGGAFADRIVKSVDDLKQLLGNYDTVVEQVARWPREKDDGVSVMIEGSQIYYWATPTVQSDTPRP